MLRINLLPPYIYAGKAKGRVTTLWVLILVAVIGGLFFFKTTIDAEKAAIDKKAQELEPTAKKADSDQLRANETNTASAVVRSKADFVGNAIKHDQEVYPNLYRNVVMYTWNHVLYDYIRPEGNTVGMSAYTPTLSDVAYYIMAMERNPNISRVDIRMNSIPGFPPGATDNQQGGQQQAPGVRPEGGGGHNFLVTLNLYQPVPAGPTFGGGGGGGQPGGAPGGMPGMGGGGGMMSGGGMGSGGMMSGGGMGSGGKQGGM